MPHREQDGEARGTPSLAHLYELARLDAQRPGNSGVGLKVIEALMQRPGFRPPSGAQA